MIAQRHGIICILLTSAALAACGGGSSDPSVSAAVITSANAPTVAGNAADGALGTLDFGDFVGAGLPLGGSVGFSATKTGSVGVASSLLLKTYDQAHVQLMQIPFGPVTGDCLISGTVTLSGDISGSQALVAGDRISAQFTNCDDGDGRLVNGGFDFLINSVSGDPASGDFSLSVTLSINSLRVLEAGTESMASGSVTMSVDNTQAPISMASVSGSSLAISRDARSLTLANFNTDVVANESAFPITWTLQSGGKLTSSQFDGQISYSTPVAFQGSGQNNPYSGEMLVRGANNASVRLIALDEVNIRLEIDSDGDNAVDETRDLTWDDIRG